MSDIVVLLGDHWAAAPRDLLGLSNRIAAEMHSRGKDWVVINGSELGGLRAAIESVPDVMLAASRAHHIATIKVPIWMGIHDASRGGGLPPDAALAMLKHLVMMVRACGGVPMFVQVPEIGKSVIKDKEVRRGLRRFRRRIEEVSITLDVGIVEVQLDDSDFFDGFTPKTSALRSVANAVVDAILPQSVEPVPPCDESSVRSKLSDGVTISAPDREKRRRV